MTTPPTRPKIYHITHLDNLISIVQDGAIHSDCKRRAAEGTSSLIGMEKLKARRIDLTVKCHSPTKVGEYVPFYFCPRSVMLYLISRGNHPELTYKGGQRPIIHLEADLHATIQWVEANNRRWAFTNTNASAKYAAFYDDVDKLSEIDWNAVQAVDFRQAAVREGKQAEFLVYEEFPLELVSRIGVFDSEMLKQVAAIIDSSDYRIKVCEKKDWYY